MKIIVFLMIFVFITSVFANETAVVLENNQIKLWIEPERKQFFKEGTVFLFDNSGMNEILAYKKTAELYRDLKIECPECKQNNTLWYLVSFGAGVVLGGLLIKVMK
jgi:hypothetical protein